MNVIWRFWRLTCNGGASAVKKPSHFEVRKSSSQVTRSQWRTRIFSGVHFFPKKVNDFFSFFLVVALKTQTAIAADCFAVKIKQIKRSDMVTFLFSVYAITEAKQWTGRSQGGGSFWCRSGVARPTVYLHTASNLSWPRLSEVSALQRDRQTHVTESITTIRGCKNGERRSGYLWCTGSNRRSDWGDIHRYSWAHLSADRWRC